MNCSSDGHELLSLLSMIISLVRNRVKVIVSADKSKDCPHLNSLTYQQDLLIKDSYYQALAYTLQCKPAWHEA